MLRNQSALPRSSSSGKRAKVRPGRQFQPWLKGPMSESELETKALPGTTFGTPFFSLSANDGVTATSTGNVAGSTGGQMYAGPYSTGAQSTASGVIQQQFVEGPTGPVTTPIVTGSEHGSAQSSIEPGTGSVTFGMGLLNTDSVTVSGNNPFGLTGGNPQSGATGELTNAVAGPTSWNVQDANGNFNPNWTVTVNINISLEAASPNFDQVAFLTVTTNQLTVSMGVGTGNPGGGSPNSIGFADAATGGKFVTAPGESNFTSGSYAIQITAPAAAVETIDAAATLNTFPDGTFAPGMHGNTGGLTVSATVTLNT
jgi:hypothetical protein